MTSTRTVTLVLATSTGGIGTHVAALSRGLAGSGWQVRVCGPPSTDELFGFSRDGADFIPTPITGSAGDVAAVPVLRRVGRDSAIVHAHGLRAATVAAFARARPLVVTWHNAVLAGSGPRRAVLQSGERFVARRADITLAASADLADRARQLGALDVRDAPVAVTLPEPARLATEVRSELQLGPRERLVVSVGRLHPQKGHDVLIEAAARWRDLDVVVVIAGDGPDQQLLARQIEVSGARVRLLGRRSDIADLLAAADLVVLASRWEARAIAVQEAMSAGRAVIVTSVGGLPGLVGSAAKLVPPDDVDALDGAVRLLLANPDLRASLAEAGRARAAGWPTEADTLAQVLAVYAELLGQSS